MRFENEILEDIEALPYGDHDKDYHILVRASVDTLKLCLKSFDGDDSYYNDLHHLVFTLIQKWETIESLLTYS